MKTRPGASPAAGASIFGQTRNYAPVLKLPGGGGVWIIAAVTGFETRSSGGGVDFYGVKEKIMNNQVNQDLEHLKMLSIFYYVAAGLSLFPALYGLFYIIMGIFFGAAIMSADAPHRPGEPSPEVIGGLFGGAIALIGFIITGVSLTIGALLFKTGRNLSARRGYTLCFVMACVCCVFMPIGTVLGVFSLIVLMRESVKAIFNGQGYQQSSPPSPPNWQ